MVLLKPSQLLPLDNLLSQLHISVADLPVPLLAVRFSQPPDLKFSKQLWERPPIQRPPSSATAHGHQDCPAHPSARLQSMSGAHVCPANLLLFLGPHLSGGSSPQEPMRQSCGCPAPFPTLRTLPEPSSRRVSASILAPVTLRRAAGDTWAHPENQPKTLPCLASAPFLGSPESTP